MLSRRFGRIALRGFGMVQVESTPAWTYTVGLVQSFEHPELVMTGLPDHAPHLLDEVVERIRTGERFDASSPPLLACCIEVAFGEVHPAQWGQGRFDEWLRYYAWLGDETLEPAAVQVLWANINGHFPLDPEFCVHGGRCQPLLDGAPRHNVNTGSNREQRRRAKYGHGKRRRR
jgi:hypothetical protein